MKINSVLNTNGKGLWSGEKRQVQLTELRCDYIEGKGEPFVTDTLYMTLRVRFNQRTWNVNRHGLIYTDDRWIRELRSELEWMGLPKYLARAIDYTEQGMQGRDFVSVGLYLKANPKRILRARDTLVKFGLLRYIK